MGQRMFVAVTPPERIRDDLAQFLEARPQLRWSSPLQWHVTLAFLSSVDEHRVDDLVARLTRVAARRRAFLARVAGAGCFPNPAHASVLWLGVRAGDDDDPVDLRHLAVGARAAANKSGTAPDGKAFVPHLTVARLRRPVQATKWLRILDTYSSTDWVVDRIELVASFLGDGPRRGPRYETVATLPLRGADA
ncbi:MAG: RNA 2',3'-cyclic phosphodiesterase [Dermatophilaceae bacterium]